MTSHWIGISLGWDPFNIDEVYPEYSVRSARVDYSLRIFGNNKVFVEAKRASEGLNDSHEEQLLGYAFREGVSLAALTNGLTWWLYLPLQSGSWRTRRFHAIEIRRQNPSDIAGLLVQFLSRGLVETGEAVGNAERIYNRQRRSEAVDEALPLAWEKVIAQPDDLLIDLVSNSVENICGFPPERRQVVDFLARVRTLSLSQQRSESEFTTATKPVSRPQGNLPYSGTGKLTLDDYKTIYTLKLKGKTHKYILEKIGNKVSLSRISEVVNGKAVTSQAIPLYKDFKLARKFPEVHAMVLEGIKDIENGDYVEYTDDTLHELFEDVKHRGRERWASDKDSSV